MNPRKAAAPSPAKEWRREAAGTYRSADGRFTLEGGGCGSWYVRDDATTDELGLPRTIGPYGTLADAKAAAGALRTASPEASPLAARIEAVPGPNRVSASRRSATARGRPTPDSPPANPVARRAAPRPTWLEALDATDREAARRARELVRQLESVGLPDADGIVRRDILGGQPEIAARLLTEAIRRATADQLSPRRLLDDARQSGVPEPFPASQSAVEPFAAFAVARTLDVALEILSRQERLSGAPAGLPGWELVERGPGRRRIRLLADPAPDGTSGPVGPSGPSGSAKR